MRRRRKRPGIGRTPRGESILNQVKKNIALRAYFLDLAGDEGFEPPNGGTRTHCLTTWRIPNGIFYFITFCPKKQRRNYG